jgi:purine-nucleoside phosphorylase
MTTPHNHAKQGDYAEAVLLPGDPLRAKWIAETFLDDARLVNSVRNCLGYTGTYKGKPVSVQATGMGQPSLSIYVHELINVYGLKTLIRVGTCGGSMPRSRCATWCWPRPPPPTAPSCAIGSAPTTSRQSPISACCAPPPTRRRKRACASMPATSDIFYHADGFAGYDKLPEHGVIGVEMEAAALYTLAARFSVKALTICTMTDCLITKEEIDANERQTSLKEMVTVALEVAIEA